MFINHPEVQDFLERGGTLVVPTRQRAAAVRLAYTAALLQQGRVIWDSPDVLHWSAWQQRQSAASRGPRALALRRLADIEEWYLWHEALQAPADSPELLQPDGVLTGLRRAAELADAWGLAPTEGAGIETMLLARLRRQLQGRRKQLGVTDPLGWRAAQGDPVQSLWCLGFDELGRADRAALQTLGVRIGTVRGPWPGTADLRAARTVAAADPGAESQLVADWCRERLRHDPRARLLVVAPKLHVYDTLLRQALIERLDGDSLVRGATDSLFAIEGGAPLLQFPLVATARTWLRAVCGRLEFAECSALLRSTYIGAGGVLARTRLEMWLRAQQVTVLGPDGPPRLLLPATQALGAEAATLLELLGHLRVTPATSEPPASWAQRWVSWLQAVGWPGDSVLSAREQQVRQRFEALLGEFAQLGDLAGGRDAQSALLTFDAWLQRASFEPASDDVPVTVSADIAHPLVRYDGIWVCGLTAQDWPPAAISSPFISAHGLLAAGCDAGTAAGALRRAEAAMRAWHQCSDELVLSWPRTQRDAELTPSPLLGPSWQAGQPAASPWRGGQAVRERYGLQRAHRWTAGHAVGGVRVLENQSLCPFRGFAMGHLHSDALQSPRAGLSRQVHGIVLHEALQRIWSGLGDSAALRHSKDELQDLVRAAVNHAVRHARQKQLLPLPAPLWDIETRLCERLIGNSLRLELQRADFSVAELEQSFELRSHGVTLVFKIDRLDRIGAQHALIDYKSGRARRFNPLAERPESPQLLAYASALPVQLCAVASLHLTVEGPSWRGAADAAGRLPQVGATGLPIGGWSALLLGWRAQIDGLLAEFAAGEARVDPLPRACESCHLSGLCRIAENDLVLNEAADDGDDLPESGT